MTRIPSSVLYMGSNQQPHVRPALASNWVSTLGPNLSAEPVFVPRRSAQA